jgi:hypothetical protein
MSVKICTWASASKLNGRANTTSRASRNAASAYNFSAIYSLVPSRSTASSSFAGPCGDLVRGMRASTLGRVLRPLLGRRGVGRDDHQSLRRRGRLPRRMRHPGVEPPARQHVHRR